MTLEQWAAVFVATAYLTYVIINEDGPLYIFHHLREGTSRLSDWFLERHWTLPGDIFGSLHDVLTCKICLPLWVALGLIRILTGQWLFVEALAVAGLCVSLHFIGFKPLE